MKWVIIGLGVIGLVFMGLGYYTQATGRSADESLGAVIPYFIGLALLGLDFVLLVGFVIYKAFTS